LEISITGFVEVPRSAQVGYSETIGLLAKKRDYTNNAPGIVGEIAMFRHYLSSAPAGKSRGQAEDSFRLAENPRIE
jgi:hypothetical protein